MITEKEAIKARHSVRAYQDRKIEDDIIEKLNKFISECNTEGNLHFQLLKDAGNTFNRLLNKFMGLGSAPSVIACIGKEASDLDERVGYYGEKIVLFAQQLGLNTCWAGTFNRKNVPVECSENEKLVIVIAVGYGENGGRERKSKTADQVVRGGISGKPDWFKTGVEYALLAPTAVNQQKFEIILNDDDSVTIEDKGMFLSKIDKGIVTYHFEVGSEKKIKE